jgi:hypothetical protein
MKRERETGYQEWYEPRRESDAAPTPEAPRVRVQLLRTMRHTTFARELADGRVHWPYTLAYAFFDNDEDMDALCLAWQQYRREQQEAERVA